MYMLRLYACSDRFSHCTNIQQGEGTRAMTTLIAIDGYQQGETRSQAVARRFRKELAGIGLKGAAAARKCHKSQPWMNRRMTGQLAFTIDELDEVCSILGLDFNYLATGIREIPDPKLPGRDGDIVSERSPVRTREGAPPRGLRLVVTK